MNKLIMFNSTSNQVANLIIPNCIDDNYINQSAAIYDNIPAIK